MGFKSVQHLFLTKISWSYSSVYSLLVSLIFFSALIAIILSYLFFNQRNVDLCKCFLLDIDMKGFLSFMLIFLTNHQLIKFYWLLNTGRNEQKVGGIQKFMPLIILNDTSKGNLITEKNYISPTNHSTPSLSSYYKTNIFSNIVIQQINPTSKGLSWKIL